MTKFPNFVSFFENTSAAIICAVKMPPGSVIPAKAGIQAHPPTWIPSRIAVRDKLFNGMTDCVRHLDSRVRGNDESSRWHREGIPAIFILRGRA